MKALDSLLKVAGSALVAGCLFSVPSLAAQASQATRAEAQRDPVLKAMLEEMDRSITDLQLKGFARPFFIQYRIEDVDAFKTRAEFGASEGAQRTHQRVVRVTVRVGDYKSDSSGARGDGALEVASLDDDPIALRSALWATTDTAYKSALAAYAQKQAALKQVQTQPQADDFSREKPVIALAAPARLDVDENAWAERMAQASGIDSTSPAVKASEQQVQYSTADFRARALTTWIVSSEGTIVRKAATEYEESFSMGTQAPDGMHIDRSYVSSGTSPQELDSPQVLAQHAVADLASLAELSKAPLVEDEFHGPLLLSADADTDTMRSLLAGALTATRPALGTEARTNGPFASSFHTRVLPDFLNVIDDPGLKSFDGKGLVGAYDYDDEGVPKQAVTLVSDGHLVNYLIGREPIKDFRQSNGHGRAGVLGAPAPGIGVLKISAVNGLTDAELNQKLLALMKEDGVDHAYSAETLAGAGNPRLLYRVNADGSRHLVRGAELDDIDQRALRSSVVAAGKDLLVANYYGDVPQTVIAPALLLDDVTVKRANDRNDKLPFYPPPQ